MLRPFYGFMDIFELAPFTNQYFNNDEMNSCHISLRPICRRNKNGIVAMATIISEGCHFFSLQQMNKIVRTTSGATKALMSMRSIGGGYPYMANIGINPSLERAGIMAQNTVDIIQKA